jgi:hypothetical protein
VTIRTLFQQQDSAVRHKRSWCAVGIFDRQ